MKNTTILLLSLFIFCFGCKKKEVGDDSNPENLSIQGFTPVSGKDGTLVTIAGNKFSTNANSNLITIGGLNVVPVSATTTELIFNVPIGLAKGMHNISVKVNGQTVNATNKFEITDGSVGGGVVNTSLIPVNADIISKSFIDFGMVNVHPRLLFTKSDIVRIKSLALTDQFAKGTYDNIISKANQILNTPLLEYALDGAGLRIPNIHEFSNEQAPFLVLAYQFTGDTKYALRCWQQVDKICSYPDWGANRHFLDSGIISKAMAIVYDGLYDYLTPEQRSKIVLNTRSKVLQIGKTNIETNTGIFKWYLTNDNWNGICHSGMIMAALAMYETDPAFMSQLIAISANGMTKYIESLDLDGASEEGMVYWGYGLSNTFLGLEAMKRVLSTEYGLAKNANGLKKTGWFPYNMSGPVGTASIGDDYLYNGVGNKFLSYFWFANFYNDANFAKAHYDACIARNTSSTAKMNGWSDLLFYNPALVSAGNSSNIPLSGYIRGIDYMHVVENNSNQNALYIGMHGGDNKASHGHLDAGSFYIQALGEVFAQGNLGVENSYPTDFFKSTSPSYNSASTNSATSRGRFYYYRVRTEGKNCLVFNPDARPEQNPDGKATLEKEGTDNIGGYYVLNMLDVYNRDVTAYKRGIKLNRNTGVISVQDEFTPKNSSTVYWLMHSPATDGMVISSDGKTATMIRNGKTFYAIIKTPSNASFVKVDRSTSSINYLTETAPIFSSIMTGQNGINQFYGKLQIKLSGVSGPTNLRVDFVKSLSTTTPSFTGLSNWTTSN